MSSSELKTEVLDVGNGQKRVFLHRDNRSDRGVFHQIFVRQDYSLQKLARGQDIYNRYASIIKSGKRPLIIDAGSNIGASAVWFQMRFPDSLVLAVEPDDENISIAKRNCYGLNVELIRGAIGSEGGRVSITNPNGEPWGFRTETSDLGEISKFAMSDLLAQRKQEGYDVFIVKIDIEGSEEELFSKQLDWVKDVPLLIIELHDWLFPKQRKSLPFLRAIAPLDRDFVYLEENIFSINNHL